MRQALITYDPARVREWDVQAGDSAIAEALHRALTGQSFDAGIGIASVDLLTSDLVAIREIDLADLFAYAQDRDG